jgi:hypothetical protein
MFTKIADSMCSDVQALGPQQGALQPLVSPVASEEPAGRDNPVARHTVHTAASHDISDGPRRSRSSGRCRDVPIRRDLTWWNAAHDAQHTIGERTHLDARERAAGSAERGFQDLAVG